MILGQLGNGKSVQDDPKKLLRDRRKKYDIKPPTVWIVPYYFQKVDAYGNTRNYELSILERIFVTFDDATASELGRFINIILLFAVLLATVFLVMGTQPGLKVEVDSCAEPACDNDANLCPNSVICEPESPHSFEQVQIVCSILFCIDYIIRMSLVGLVPTRIADCLPKGWEDDVPQDIDDDFREMKRAIEDPEFPWYYKLYQYFLQPMNLIDLGAILPFIIENMISSKGIPFGTEFIRMLRLARIFRIFKVGKNNASINLLFLTLTKSFPALVLMGFFLSLGVVIFGSTMFICESGKFTVNNEYNGTFLRPDLYGHKEHSPFKNIAWSFYWAFTTSTTVGYGDLYPTTMAGRLVCIVSTFCALIVVALPVSVIGNNFNREYDNIKSGKYDVVVESIVELLNQQTVDMAILPEEDRDYVMSRKCLAITAIADHMTNTVQAEKVKAVLRLRGYEQALDRTRIIAKTQGRRVSLSYSPSMPSNPSSGRSSPKVTVRNANPEKVQKVAALAAQLKAAIDEMKHP